MESIRNFLRNHQGNFLKFSAVGVINTLIDFTVFALLFYVASLPALIAHIISFGLATVNSFIMNKNWTFRDAVAGKREAVLFLAVTTSALVITSMALVLLSAFMSVFMAKVLTIGISVVWNYAGSRWVVFRK